LAEFLVKKGYEVSGIVRKTSHEEYANIGGIQDHLKLFQGDLLDPVSLREIIQKVNPDEVYNLASQSHPSESFKQPIHTAEITNLVVHGKIKWDGKSTSSLVVPQSEGME
jgi:GDPmannose 4,6-dehydratase